VCVMCQFLIQRVQQDMAGLYGTNPAGLGPVAAMGGLGGGVLLVETAAEEDDEDADEDADELELEDEQEEEDQDETELEAEDETEDETADQGEEELEADEEDSDSDIMALLQIEDSDEQAVEDENEDEDEADGEWQTPEYNNAHAEHPVPTALLETADAADFQTPQFTAAANDQEDETEAEEAEAEEDVEEAAAGTADTAEPAFFESAGLVNRGEDGSDVEWTEPEYTAHAASPIPAATAFIQTSDVEVEVEEGADAGWQTPVYSDAVQPQSTGKQYARIIPSARPQPQPQSSLLEASAQQSVASNERILPRIVASLAAEALNAGKQLRFRNSRRSAYEPRRYKTVDRLYARPRWNRYDPTSPRHPTAERIAATRQFELATHVAYDKLEGYCSTRLPESFGKFCRPILRTFRPVAEGLRYGDRVEQVCMNIRLCPRKSYVRQRPHAVAARN